MNELNIKSSQSTPSVVTDSTAGILRMAGDSYPENSFDFFNDIIAWVESYLADSDASLYLEIRLVYMNTSSVKAMLDIFDILEEAHGKGRKVGVDWYYDPLNERIVELAEEFSEDCTFPFRIQPEGV